MFHLGGAGQESLECAGSNVMRLGVEQRDDVRVRREFRDGVDRKGAVASVEQEDGNRGAVGNALKVGEHLTQACVGLRAINTEGGQDTGFANQNCVVAEFSGEPGELKGRVDAVVGDAGNEDFFGSSGFGGCAQNFARLVVREQRWFSRWAKHHQPGGRRA